MAIDRFQNPNILTELKVPILNVPVYSVNDISRIQKSTLSCSKPLLDNSVVEKHIYSQNNLIKSLSNPIAYEFNENSVDQTYNILLNPEEDIRLAGIKLGYYSIVYNFFKSIIPSLKIQNISVDSTELQLIPNVSSAARLLLDNPLNNLRNLIDNQTTYKENLVLNFGNNRAYTITDVSFDTTSGVLVKLYTELPIDLENENCSIDIVVRDSYIERIQVFPHNKEEEIEDFSSPNFNIDLGNYAKSQGTDFKTWNSLLDTNLSTSQQIIDKYISGSFGEVNLNIDYTSFDNFVKYSSAVERVNNLKYKLELIESYNSRISILESVSGSEALTNISQSITRRDAVISGMDGWERWMYYQSTGSLYTHYSSSQYTISPWPKQSEYPVVNYSVTSAEGISHYNGLIDSASIYDALNDSRLTKLIPASIVEDTLNQDYILFVDMIGHHFDITWSYIKALTSLSQREEHPYDGIPNEMLFDAAKSMGWKLTQGKPRSDLWKFAVGTDKLGNPIQSGSLKSKPDEQINYEVWRRIVNNIPYLLKTKGSARAVKALMATYGIPQTFLSIREYGGPMVEDVRPIWEHDRFVYKLRTSPSKYIITPWDSIDGSVPSMIEVIANPPQSNYHLFRMTGSGYVDYFWDYDATTKSARVRLNVDGTDTISSSYAPYPSQRDVVFTLASSSMDIKSTWVDDFGNTLGFVSASSVEANENFGDIWSGFIGNEVLQVQGTDVSGFHFTQTNTLGSLIPINSQITASVYFYIPKSNQSVTKFQFRSANDADFSVIDDTVGEWTFISASYSPSVNAHRIRFQLLPDSGFSFDDNNESIYFKDLRIVSSSGDVFYTSSWYSGGDIFVSSSTNTNAIPTILSQPILDDYPTTIQFSGPSINTTASLQEIRYYTNPLSDSTLVEHSKNREAYHGNTPTSSYYDLKFRFLIDSQIKNISNPDTILSQHPNRRISNTDSGYPLTASLFNFTPNDLVGVVEEYYTKVPSAGANNILNNKVRIEENTLQGLLDVDNKKEKSKFDTAPVDTNQVGIYLSATKAYNEDIYNHAGYFTIDDYVGNPDSREGFNDENNELNQIRRDVFKKYSSKNLINNTINILARYDLSIFNQIKQVLPARVDYNSGILIEPHVLERPKVKSKTKITYTRPQYDVTLPLISQTIVSAQRDDIVSVGNPQLGDMYEPSIYKYTILNYSSSANIGFGINWTTGSNGYWNYTPTSSTAINPRLSKYAKKQVYFYSTDLSASLRLSNSSSLVPAGVSTDELPLSINNLRYFGCKMTSDSLTTNSPDTPDGKPVIEVFTADPNVLIYTSQRADEGNLDVDTRTNINILRLDELKVNEDIKFAEKKEEIQRKSNQRILSVEKTLTEIQRIETELGRKIIPHRDIVESEESDFDFDPIANSNDILIKK